MTTQELINKLQCYDTRLEVELKVNDECLDITKIERNSKGKFTLVIESDTLQEDKMEEATEFYGNKIDALEEEIETLKDKIETLKDKITKLENELSLVPPNAS